MISRRDSRRNVSRRKQSRVFLLCVNCPRSIRELLNVCWRTPNHPRMAKRTRKLLPRTRWEIRVLQTCLLIQTLKWTKTFPSLHATTQVLPPRSLSWHLNLPKLMKTEVAKVNWKVEVVMRNLCLQIATRLRNWFHVAVKRIPTKRKSRQLAKDLQQVTRYSSLKVNLVGLGTKCWKVHVIPSQLSVICRLAIA